MPTAGEARFVAKTSKDGISVKSRSIPVDAKRRVKRGQTLGKSSVPVPISVKKGKENTDPNTASAGNVTKRTTKVKGAPDFSKLHRKWQDQFAKGKAVAKKKNTAVEAFNLTKNSHQTRQVRRPYAYNSEDEEDTVSNADDDFEIDSTALKSILDETGIKGEDLGVTGRATIATVNSSESSAPGQSCAEVLKRTSIYFTRPRTQTAVSPLKPRNVETSKPQAPASVKKQVAWADQALFSAPEGDGVDFEPDFSALQSILRNTGIVNNQMRIQSTGRVTLAGGKLTPYRGARQALREEPTKRTSIYYTGPKRARPSPRAPEIRRTSVFQPSQRTEGAALTSGQKSHVGYNPLTTVVGRQCSQQDEKDPIASFAAGELQRRAIAPVSQPVKSNPLLTPARKPEPGSQSSSARKPSSWADIFTPQRITNFQQSDALPSRSSPSFDSLQTRVPMQLFTESKTQCTPQRVMGNSQTSQGPVYSTVANSSAKGLNVVSNRQPEETCVSSAQRLVSISKQSALTSQPMEFDSRHTLLTSQGRQPQSSLLTESCPHAQSCNQTSRTFSSSSIKDAQAITPLPIRGSQVACSKLQRPAFGSIVTPIPKSAIQERASRLHCSTIQVTSFQPYAETEVAGSLVEARQPQQSPASHMKQLKGAPEKEEEEIARLERQALEDMALLHIRELSHEETTVKSSCSNQDKANSDANAMSIMCFNSCDSNKLAGSALEQQRNSVALSEGRNLLTARNVSSNSLSLRSACPPSNPDRPTPRKAAFDTDESTRFCWEPSGADDSPRVFRPASSTLAKEALLDMEVSSYMLAGHDGVVTPVDCRRKLTNPLARVFVEGDSMHFLPIRL